MGFTPFATLAQQLAGQAPVEFAGASQAVQVGARVTGDTTDRVTVDSDRLGLGNGNNGQPVSLLYAGGGGITIVGGFIDFQTAGKGLQVNEGANGKQGRAALTAGAVTVANTSVTANSEILPASQVDGGTPGFLRVSTRTAGTSFTITSSSGTDTSTAGFEMFEPG